MILLIDNYDSFTFNIVDYLHRTGQQVQVIKNDSHTLEDIKKLKFDKIVISPGPGSPNTAGISMSVVDHFAKQCPILGICLGHQIIAQYFGFDVIAAPQPMHGKMDLITHDQKGLFAGLKNPLTVIRYHSLIAYKKQDELDALPLTVSARNNQNIIMGLRHKQLPIESVQFHPEAIKTECGIQMINNFIEKYR